jgi:2-dehydro-3-deoxyphosphooctonate aldolase (KDO 8-P synthase)
MLLNRGGLIMVNEMVLNERVKFGENHPFVLIAGPCMLESETLAMSVAEKINEITNRLSIPFVFKGSFDKANRSSIFSQRGPGLEKGLKILQKIKEEYKVPVTSDIHEASQATEVKDVLDIIQIPAFLCRQTDLLTAATKTGKIVKVKKGQFLEPHAMRNIVKKINEAGGENILLTERGTTFGYGNLVVDMRSLVTMREFGTPIVFDATHSVQIPSGDGATTGGKREFVPFLSKAAIAIGIDALFLEVHPEPDKALSDGPNMVKLSELEEILKPLVEIDRLVKG